MIKSRRVPCDRPLLNAEGLALVLMFLFLHLLSLPRVARNDEESCCPIRRHDPRKGRTHTNISENKRRNNIAFENASMITAGPVALLAYIKRLALEVDVSV